MCLQGSAIAPLGIQPPPNGPGAVPTETLLSKFPELENKRLLLFLGRICRLKACDSLLRAFSEVCRRDPRLHLVMTGPDFEGWQADLVHLSEKLGLHGRVTWTGPLYSDLKWEALRAAELFVLPSHCETFPVAVLEALGCGTPVLISDQVGIYREVFDARAGLVCRDEDASLIEALQTWLRLGSESRAAYRSAANGCFQKHFELQTATSRQLEVIRTFSGPVDGKAILPSPEHRLAK